MWINFLIQILVVSRWKSQFMAYNSCRVSDVPRMYIPNYGEKGFSGAAIDLICTHASSFLLSVLYACSWDCSSYNQHTISRKLALPRVPRTFGLSRVYYAFILRNQSGVCFHFASLRYDISIRRSFSGRLRQADKYLMLFICGTTR